VKNHIIFACLLIGQTIFSGCATIDVYFREDISGKPNKILIGFFEKRNYTIDPLVEKNIREALRFELNKRGYSANLYLAEKSKIINTSDEIKKVLADTGADCLFQGSIALSSSGDAFSIENSAMLAVSLFDKNGKPIGEIRRAMNDDITQIDIITKSVSEIVNEFDSRIGSLAETSSNKK
jgi:hypothetical protein